MKFKEFLSESAVDHFPIVTIYAEMVDQNLPRYNTVNFIAGLKEQGEKHGFELAYDHHGVGIAWQGGAFKAVIRVTNRELMGSPNLYTLENYVGAVAEKIGEVDDVMVAQVQVDWPPAFPMIGVKNESVDIHLYTKGTVLENLNQLIPLCGSLTIVNCEKLAEVLSLLSYSGTRHLELQSMAEKEMGKRLNAIFTKHFTGDKNVLELQDELIEAGLEEFATL